MTIERITSENYQDFCDMLYWRAMGKEEKAPLEDVPDELNDRNLYVYAAREESRFVGWISLTYLPKVSRVKKGYVYVDELWVAEKYRNRGIAKALMAKADEMKTKLDATGIRLYVNENNPIAHNLYTACGFSGEDKAYFMEK